MRLPRSWHVVQVSTGTPLYVVSCTVTLLLRDDWIEWILAKLAEKKNARS